MEEIDRCRIVDDSVVDQEPDQKLAVKNTEEEIKSIECLNRMKESRTQHNN